ncbi:four helix bundle protein [Candidatus Curtissbacteria bacterium]|nr:four helix bundle protein [Candidatus Curtissbacteria bacterium]
MNSEKSGINQSDQSKPKVRSYQDLIVWQRAHKLALELYKLSKSKKKSFADWEIWRQAISSAFSVPANIAEGFHSHRGKSFASHLEISRGSEGETDYWIVVLVEIGQIDKEKGDLLSKECQEIIAMLTGLIKKIR